MKIDGPVCLAMAPSFPLRVVRGLLVLAIVSSSVWALGYDGASEATFQVIESKYRVPVISSEPTFPVRISTGQIGGTEARRENIAEYAKMFVAEFSLYPVEFVQRTRLRRIVLCEELSFSGQLRTALPDFENSTLYLDVARGASNKTYMRTVLHHEFFHLIDYADDGEIYRDDKWAALNLDSFSYGMGGKDAQSNRDTSRLTDRYPGFLNHYSTTGVEEDKAEVFSNLIVRALHVERVVRTDPVIDAKVRHMKKLLQDFSSDLDEGFWKEAKKLAR